MKRALFVAVMTAALGTAASAQMTADPSHNPIVKGASVHHSAKPATGRNSFTESQAQGRIAKAGYMHVGKLAKDSDGAWQGKAMKDGKPVTVALDYKGDVTAR